MDRRRLAAIWPSELNIKGIGHARFLSLLFLLVAIFAGKYSFDRFADESARTSWLELRLWFTLASVFCWILWRHRVAVPPRVAELKLPTLLAVLASVYFLINAWLVGGRPLLGAEAGDLLYACVFLLLLFDLAREDSALGIFALTAELLGLGMFVLAAAGVGHAELYGPGWAPFGSPITFYRIEFLAFASALYLATRSEDPIWRWGNYAVALCCVFAMFTSLSRGATIGLLATVGYWVFRWMVAKKYKEIVWVLLCVGVAFMSFVVFKGRILEARMAESGTGAAATSVAVAFGSAAEGVETAELESDMSPFGNGISAFMVRVYARDLSDEGGLSYENLSVKEQNTIRDVASVFELPKYDENLESFLRYGSRLVLFDDSSVRMRLFLAALDRFKQAPLFGGGVGTFRLWAIHPYDSKIETFDHPHNLVLEVLSEAGMIGAVLVFGALGAFLVRIERRTASSPELLYPIGIVLFFFVTGLFGGDLYDFRFAWVAALLALATAARRDNQRLQFRR